MPRRPRTHRGVWRRRLPRDRVAALNADRVDHRGDVFAAPVADGGDVDVRQRAALVKRELRVIIAQLRVGVCYAVFADEIFAAHQAAIIGDAAVAPDD